MNFELIFFDLDGTLFDTLPDITDSVNYMLKKLNKKQLAKNVIKNYIGNGARILIEKVLKNYDISIEKGLDLFINYYSKNYLNKTKPYDGVIDTLKILKTTNIILTNKPLKIAEDIINNYNLNKYFKHIIGPETFGKKKPDPTAVFEISNNLNIDINKCLIVGDSLIDIDCAKNAGISCYCVSYGYGKLNEILKADRIINNLKEIIKIL